MDVVITATLRPELLDLTLRSFAKHLFAQLPEVRIVINIDRLGDANCSVEDILAVCRRYTARVVHRSPDQPSFARAVQWGWQQVESEFFLHLEDDWFLKRRVDIAAALAPMQQDAEIASVRLNRSTNAPHSPVWSPSFSLNPSFIRRTFIAEALSIFSTDLDPEKQFCDLEGERLKLLGHWKFLCYGAPSENAYVVDTGRKWRKVNNFIKWQSPRGEITWEGRVTTHHRLIHYLLYKTFLWRWKYLSIF